MKDDIWTGGEVICVIIMKDDVQVEFALPVLPRSPVGFFLGIPGLFTALKWGSRIKWESHDTAFTSTAALTWRCKTLFLPRSSPIFLDNLGQLGL